MKNVTLDNTAITDDWLKNHLSKLLLLENLILESCKILGEIDICHQKLKSLVLLNCDNLVKAKIEAPNLISLCYNKRKHPETLFPVITLQCSSQLLANLILFGISPTNDEQFMNFKNFLVSLAIANRCRQFYMARYFLFRTSFTMHIILLFHSIIYNLYISTTYILHANKFPLFLVSLGIRFPRGVEE